MRDAIEAAIRRGDAIRIIGAGPSSGIVTALVDRTELVEACGSAVKVLLARGTLPQADQVAIECRTLPRHEADLLCEQYYDGSQAWFGAEVSGNCRRPIEGRLVDLDQSVVRQAAVMFDGLWHLASPRFGSAARCR